MERHGIGDKEAFERLREHARSSNRRVVDVAQAVVDGHALLPARGAARRTRPPAGPGTLPLWPRPGTLATVVRDGRPGPAIEPGDFKRAFTRFQKDQITDHAAGLTYYALMSLFPALLFGVAVLGLFGQQGLITDPPTSSLRRRARATRSTRSRAPWRRRRKPRHGGGRARARARDVAVRRLGRVRRGRPRAQHDLAGRGGPRVRQAQAPRPPVDARGARARARHVRARVPRRLAVGVRLQPDRARGDDRGDLALRPLAGGAARDDPDLRRRLLRGAERGDPALPVDHPGRGVRGASPGCSPRPPSSPTSRTSAPTPRPTAPSPPP